MNRTTWKQHLPSLSFVTALAVVLGLGAAAFIYLGIYNIAADVPHTPAVYSLLERLRDRSIETHSQGIVPPADLASAQRVSTGAGLYMYYPSRRHSHPALRGLVDIVRRRNGLAPLA